MKRRRRWLGGSVFLVTLAMGGCNLIFGITGGTPDTTSGSGMAGAGAASSATSTTTGSSSTSSTTGTGGTGGHAGLAVSPASATLLSLTTLTFAATLDGAPADVTWTVVEPGGGAVTSPGGVYRAPETDGKFHVEATLGAETKQATVTVQTTATPVTIVATGEVATATGHGSQSHLAYAEGTGQWWLFHDPASGGQLATLFSDGFATWQPGESVTFAPEPPPDGDGRDLSVACRSINGHDVVHVAQGYLDVAGSTLGRYHLRATLSAGHVAFDPAASINSINTGDPTGLMPDGCSTAILPSGQVIDASGYVVTNDLGPAGSLGAMGDCGAGDADAFASVGKDDGSSPFDSASFVHQVLWCVPSVVGSRQVLAVGDAAVMLYDDADSEPPGNVLASTFVNGAWSPVEPASGSFTTPPLVFSTGASIGRDDWTAAVLNGAVHVVRRTDSGFDHAVLPSVGGAWTAGGSIEALSTLPDSGLFLAPYGDGLLLAALSPDSGSQLVYTYFDGTTWSMWSFLTDPSSDVRGYLSGYAPAGGAKPALVWTVTAGPSYGIGGLLLP